MKKNVLYAIMLLSSVCIYAEDCYVSFTKGQRATIILPVAPDAEKGRYYKLDRVENRQIIFEEEVSPRARMRFASSEAVRPSALKFDYEYKTFIMK